MINYVISILIMVVDYDKKLDYERGEKGWKKMKRLSPGDWDINSKAIIQWSPFSSEADLLRQVRFFFPQCMFVKSWYEDLSNEQKVNGRGSVFCKAESMII